MADNGFCRPLSVSFGRQRILSATGGRQAVLPVTFGVLWPTTDFAGHRWPASGIVPAAIGDDRPLPGADVLVLFPNRTWKRAATDDQGRAAVDLHTTALPMTVFVAAPGQAGHVEREWRPDRGALAVTLDPLPAGGSVVFPEATGRLPGLAGELNPVRDPHDRICLYASNVIINEGEPQPVYCLPEDELRLTDAGGREMLVRIAAVAGRSALVTYRPVDS